MSDPRTRRRGSGKSIAERLAAMTANTERFVSPVPLPTEHERELLNILNEELHEAGHRIGKLLRFGRDEVQTGQPHSNSARLAEELGHVVAMIQMCQDAHLINGIAIDVGRKDKLTKVQHWMQTHG